MIKVVGTWELGYNTPLIEYDLWAFPLRDFGVDEFIMSPISGIDRKKFFKEEVDIPTVVKNNPDLVPIYLDEKGTTLLQDFEHPDNALYILGKASYSPWIAGGSVGISVKIPTSFNGGLLWPHQVICMTLYDRMMKACQL